ncbi:MAG: KUP/HAK/KT family potassium transporter, partial [Myxococcaceae bacterium]|nr:KUP/HAK/KT family potassium transporter [Myxococcaceae bacterium]
MSLVAAPPAHDVAPAVTTPAPARLWPLALAALGVVFGDIGTSPLYAVKECFAGTHGLPVTRDNVLGILSLFFWSLFMVVAVKYLVFIMRADNRGEGGLFALLALIPRDVGGRLKTAVVLAALFGAALLYGDGIITPAISVLSAVEGLAANPLTGEETAMKP